MTTTTTPTSAIQGCCGLIDPALDTEEAVTLADAFKALADPTRVRMVNLLARNGELCVCDVQEHFDLAQPTISHHLSVLRKAGLVRSETRGRWAFYRVVPEAIAALSGALEVNR